MPTIETTAAKVEALKKLSLLSEETLRILSSKVDKAVKENKLPALEAKVKTYSPLM
jgi:hypothetical protein